MLKTKPQPKTWQRTKLGDFVTLNYGKGLPERDRVVGPYPVYGSAGVVDTNKDYLVEGPGIVVGRKGSVGEIYYTDKNYFPIDTVYYITKNGKYNLRFLYYLLKTIDFKSLNSDAAVPGLNRNTAYAQEVLLPPCPTQEQIANVLSTYDDLIENNTKRIKILEEIVQAIYREWFVHFHFPGYEKVKMVNNNTEFSKIPEGWKIGKLEDIGELIKQPYTDGDENLPLVDMSRMQSGTLAINGVGKSSDLSTSRIIFIKDDVLFGSIRTYLYKVVLAPFRGITNISVFVIRPRAIFLKAFLTISMFKKETIDWTNQYSTGTKMPVIKWDVMRGMPVIIPTRTILKSFQNAIWPMLEQIQSFYYINAKLRQARDLLLPKLINGEIRV